MVLQCYYNSFVITIKFSYNLVLSDHEHLIISARYWYKWCALSVSYQLISTISQIQYNIIIYRMVELVLGGHAHSVYWHRGYSFLSISIYLVLKSIKNFSTLFTWDIPSRIFTHKAIHSLVSIKCSILVGPHLLYRLLAFALYLVISNSTPTPYKLSLPRASFHYIEYCCVSVL